MLCSLARSNQRGISSGSTKCDDVLAIVYSYERTDVKVEDVGNQWNNKMIERRR